MIKNDCLDNFYEHVILKYQIYNGLFLDLPFEKITYIGSQLPVFSEICLRGLNQGKHPKELIKDFIDKLLKVDDKRKKHEMLFLFLLFIERQVLLFDSIEEAFLQRYVDMKGPGSIYYFLNRVIESNKVDSYHNTLSHYAIRIVLTAHPTEFYPEPILNIREDLINAIKKGDIREMLELLRQMGKTTFHKKERPTPIDEALTLIRYLKKIFYHVLPRIRSNLINIIRPFNLEKLAPMLEMGFWPGGDRDGNPFVKPDTTDKVLEVLRKEILHLYLDDLSYLNKKLTFKGMENEVTQIKKKLKNTLIYKEDHFSSAEDFIIALTNLSHKLQEDHGGLFSEKVEELINKVKIFGFYFASLDLRQDSRIHTHMVEELIDNYFSLNPNQKFKKLETCILENTKIQIDLNSISEELQDAFQYLNIAKDYQVKSGERAIHRYIISNTQNSCHLLEVIFLAIRSGWDLDHLTLDVVPLFETIGDLDQSERIMEELYSSPVYMEHLKKRKMKQYIMLGFSDGTKDGGYITANWAILKCKQALSKLSKKYKVQIVFFDGRGGPPARGGGNTHRYYKGMSQMITQDEVQLTIQGQTISSNYGTNTAAIYNVEKIFTAGIEEYIFKETRSLSEKSLNLIEELSLKSSECYQSFKDHPLFISYLEEITPLKFFSDMKIASRPIKRKNSNSLVFEDLRAIPFVASWSVMKQNVPGFFGVGTAILNLIEKGKEKGLKKLYRSSPFFSTLIDNCMQSLSKTNLFLTQYLKDDKVYSDFWNIIADEAKLTEEMVLKISETQELLQKDPIIKQSIKKREEVIVPLLVIQQYALDKIRYLDEADEDYQIYYRMILKSIAANINACRNSA